MSVHPKPTRSTDPVQSQTSFCVCVCVRECLNEPILKCLWNINSCKSEDPPEYHQGESYPPDVRKFHEVTVTRILVPEFHSKAQTSEHGTHVKYKMLYVNDHSNLICKSQKVDPVPKLSHRWMNEQWMSGVVGLNGGVFDHQKERNTNSGHNWAEPWKRVAQQERPVTEGRGL